MSMDSELIAKFSSKADQVFICTHLGIVGYSNYHECSSSEIDYGN